LWELDWRAAAIVWDSRRLRRGRTWETRMMTAFSGL
jgi:hypothetical protein